jgi:hypothetical protein
MVGSIKNKVNMIYMYGEAGNNSARTALFYTESYVHRHPPHQTVENWELQESQKERDH